jgi:hypothetical protein
MNPIFQWILAHTIAKAHVRECPKCHHKQIVPKGKTKESVPCASCDLPIAPKKASK